MLQTVHEPRRAEPPATFRETCLAAFRFMLLARVLDDKFAALTAPEKSTAAFFSAAARKP